MLRVRLQWAVLVILPVSFGNFAQPRRLYLKSPPLTSKLTYPLTRLTFTANNLQGRILCRESLVIRTPSEIRRNPITRRQERKIRSRRFGRYCSTCSYYPYERGKTWLGRSSQRSIDHLYRSSNDGW